MERIGLKDAIAALRAELSESILAASDEDLRFQVGDISLEFKFEIERTVEAAGGIKFWVVEAGGKGSLASTNTHTVAIPLKPVTVDGRPVLTGRRTDVVPE